MNASPDTSRLAGRRILLGVTGGIAAYKAADLVRRLREAGATVQVVMTAGAQRFVTAQTFQALSGRPVRDSLWDEAAEAAMGHIELARWPDAVLIAPASADVIARLAQGRADDLLTTLCLATDRPLMIAPAMNRLMWANPATQSNVAALRERGAAIIGPGAGSQACGETGEGRMVEPSELRDALIDKLADGALAGVRVAINAGPTREPIDPVRMLSNRSSGKMGFALAAALADLGADVQLIAGPVALPTPPRVARRDVETAADMLAASVEACADRDLFIGTAAVADYRPAQRVDQKIKKHAESMTINLERTTDVLMALRERYPDLFLVGFAAETQDLAAAARDKLERKGLQLVAANAVNDGKVFDRDDTALEVFWPGGGQSLGQGSKDALARELARLIAERFAAHHA